MSSNPILEKDVRSSAKPARPRPSNAASIAPIRKAALLSGAARGLSALRRPDRPARHRGLVHQARPAPPGAKPGDVRGPRGERLHDGALGAVARWRRGGASRVHSRHLPLAVVHGPLRQLRRGHGRRARQGAGRRTLRQGRGRTSMPRSSLTVARRGEIGDPRLAAPKGRVRARRGGRLRPHGRRDPGRGRVGRRERDHRRERAGHPRERRRPQLGDRRDSRAVRLDRRARLDLESGRDVPRPDDRDGGGGEAAEDRRTRSRSTSFSRRSRSSSSSPPSRSSRFRSTA